MPAQDPDVRPAVWPPRQKKAGSRLTGNERVPVAPRRGVGRHRAIYLQSVEKRDAYTANVLAWSRRYPVPVLRELAKLPDQHGELAQAALRYLARADDKLT